ncbi:Hpt domain-containing protein [Halocola ammonii]
MSEENLIDLNHLKNISGGNREFVCEILQIFVLQTPEELDKLHSHIEKDEFEKIEYYSHKLKSAADSIGFVEGQMLFKQIEDHAHQKAGDQIPMLFSKVKETCSRAFSQVEKELDSGV